MLRTIPIALLCSLFLVPQSRGQEVSVPRQLRKLPVIKPDLEEPAVEFPKPAEAKESAAVNQDQAGKAEPAKLVVTKPATSSLSNKTTSTKTEPVKSSVAKETAINSHLEKVKPSKIESEKKVATKEAVNSGSERPPLIKKEAVRLTSPKELVSLRSEKPIKAESMALTTSKGPAVNLPTAQESMANVSISNGPTEMAATRLADGFDFPVGKPDAEGYYRARGYRAGGHMGEDWDGVRGGDTDLGDPIYSIGDGIVVFARDVHLGWGNVVIVRHAFKEEGMVKHIDSLYGHLNSILVKRGQRVARGQEIGTMGTAHGQYDAHLHLEIRKNIEIGMSKSKFQRNLSNYYDPSQFISSHRHLSGGGASFRVAMNTFTHDSAFHFDNAPNFGPHKRSTAQSAAALRRAVSNASASDRDQQRGP